MKLTLDVSKWRCGSSGFLRLGTGFTWLLNKDGYSCCLGQFAMQLGCDEKTILNKGNYQDAEIKNGELCNMPFYKDICLGNELIDINDAIYTTPIEKIEKIKDILQEHDIELEVIDETQILSQFS